MSSSSGGPLPRLLVVDADPRTRESLAGVLGIGQRVEVVGSAGDAVTALALVDQLDPDIVIVDPRLPEIERGRAFVSRLRDVRPGCSILVMNGAVVAPEGWEPLGADACVRKTFRAHELVDAVLAARKPAVTS